MESYSLNCTAMEVEVKMVKFFLEDMKQFVTYNDIRIVLTPQISSFWTFEEGNYYTKCAEYI